MLFYFFLHLLFLPSQFKFLVHMNTVVDRLSNLQKEIANEIFCFLPGEDLIRLSFVSKRFRNLCFGTPFLSFDDAFNLSDDRFTLTPGFDDPSWIRRTKCIDSFMNLRHLKGNRIQSFSLRWFYGDSNDVFYVNKWLFQAFDCGVQEVNLVVVPRTREITHPAMPGEVFAGLHLPLSILNSKTLKKLAISLSSRYSIQNPPSFFVRLNFLEYLKLQFVHLSGSGGRGNLEVGELVSSCKCLKELFLIDCTGSWLSSINSSSLLLFHFHCRKHYHPSFQIPQLEISAPNLQELDIVWFPPFSTDVPSSLEICTPKLQVFNWMGNPIRDFKCLAKLAHLERAGLNFMEFPPNNDYAVDEVVHSIDNITCLQPLCLRSIAVLARGNGIPFVFHHLKSLVIVGSGLSAYEVAPLRSLLMGTPNLRELGITSRGLSPYSPSPSQAELISQSVAASYGSEYWESGLVSFGQLKILTIELFEGPFLLELFKFLLKNAELLEKVTVYYSTPSIPQEAAAIIATSKKDSSIFSIRAI